MKANASINRAGTVFEVAQSVIQPKHQVNTNKGATPVVQGTEVGRAAIQW
jgi:hypothetical protein